MNLQAVVRQGFRARLFQAHGLLEAREGSRISREEIGKRLGKLLKTTPVDQSTVASWFNRGVIPLPELGILVAAVYGVNAGWLYFNEGAQMSEAEPIGNHTLKPTTKGTQLQRSVDLGKKKRGSG